MRQRSRKNFVISSSRLRARAATPSTPAIKTQHDRTQAHAAEYAQLCETEDKPQEKLPEEVAETEAQLEAAKRAAAIEEAIAAEEAAADQEAEAKREALAASIKQRFEEDARKEELAARATLAKLMKEESSDDDSDVELEIVGAPSPAKKARRESLSPSKSTTVEALKRARTKRAGGRRALRDKLRAKAARAGMVKYAEQASVEDISADDYVRRLEALDAQRVVEAREAERRDREERELEQKLRAAGRRFAEIDAREEELFVPDAEDALAMDRAAAQDAIQACLDAQRRAEVLTSVPEESPEAWSSPSPEPAATLPAEEPSATVLAEDLGRRPQQPLWAPKANLGPFEGLWGACRGLYHRFGDVSEVAHSGGTVKHSYKHARTARAHSRAPTLRHHGRMAPRSCCSLGSGLAEDASWRPSGGSGSPVGALRSRRGR